MEYLSFLLQVFLVSLTGVMAPGPITALTLAKGNESPHAGAAVAAGHAIVEVPLMAAVYFGSGRLLAMQRVKASIGLAGGIVLAIMAVGMIRSISRISGTGDDSMTSRSGASFPTCARIPL